MFELPKSVRARMRRALSGPQPGGAGEHPDADLLNAFCEDALAGAERERMLAHLAACPQCREVVALIAPAEGPPRPAFQPTKSWLSLPVVRWGAVVTAAAVVIAVALLQRPEAPRRAISDAQAPAPVTSGSAGKLPAAATTAAPPGAVTQPEKKELKPSQGPPSGAKPPAPSHGVAGFTDSAESRKTDYFRRSLRGDQTLSESPRQKPRINTANDQRAHGPAALLNQPMVPPVEQQFALPPAGTVGGAFGKSAITAELAPRAPGEQSSAEPAPPAPAAVAGQSAPPPRPGAAAETVQVEAAAPPVPSSQVVGAVPEKSLLMGANSRKALAKDFMVLWSISPQGKLLRSVAGATWQPVAAAGNITFRAVATVGNDVWAGGNHGRLIHSTDGGATWEMVAFPASEDIAGIAFSSLREGVITTASGQQFATHDAGRTWTKIDGR